MLKREKLRITESGSQPAAFGRLCVETLLTRRVSTRAKPAAFGRLCVETGHLEGCAHGCIQPPSGGCVLKLSNTTPSVPSAQPAAFGRLCVETGVAYVINVCDPQPPSGGCVLKQRYPYRD